MAWCLNGPDADSTLVRFICNKKYTLGRKNCDILIECNAAVSRLHCEIELQYSEDQTVDINKLPSVTVTDKSKAGTFINGKKIVDKQILHNEDKIQFGTAETWTLRYNPLLVCTSSVGADVTKKLKERLVQLGGHLIEQWKKEMNYLVMDTVKATPKALSSLICQQPIVLVTYFDDYVDSVKKGASTLPNPNDYVPPIASDEMLRPSDSLASTQDDIDVRQNIRRKTLFKGKTFLFTTNRSHETLSGLLKFGGGETVLVNKAKRWCRLHPKKELNNRTQADFSSSRINNTTVNDDANHSSLSMPPPTTARATRSNQDTKSRPSSSIDDLFSSSATITPRNNKRTRQNQQKDEFDELFDISTSSSKRHRADIEKKDEPMTVDQNRRATNSTLSQVTTTPKFSKSEVSKTTDSEKRKQSMTTIDAFFDNIDTNKRLKRMKPDNDSSGVIKTGSDPFDIFGMSSASTTMKPVSKISSSLNDITTKINTNQKNKKVNLFFDVDDLPELKEEMEDEKNSKINYVQTKPIVVNVCNWMTKPVKKVEPVSQDERNEAQEYVPQSQRNLMHIQFSALVLLDTDKKHRSSTSEKNKNKSKDLVSDGKCFRKQLVLSDSTIVRKENLQSCFNALLEDTTIAKASTTKDANKTHKKTTPKSRKKLSTVMTDDDLSDDDELNKTVEFF
ncbi:unnamed protein product, partial [Didymodactylos carnosus]